MLKLITELQANEDVCVILSSHLLRDVESVSDHVVILKDGRIVADSNLQADRASRRRFVELEVDGDRARFLAQLDALGIEHAPGLRERIKLVLPPETPSSTLFSAAESTGSVIRRLSQRRDSLEDKFLQAMGLDPSEMTGVRS